MLSLTILTHSSVLTLKNRVYGDEPMKVNGSIPLSNTLIYQSEKETNIKFQHNQKLNFIY